MQTWTRYCLLAGLTLLVAAATLVHAAPTFQTTQPIAPTYNIFATREGLVGRRTANGHIIKPRDRFVALPSWTALSPKGDNQYQVRLTYKGKSTIAPVWDVGPWNTKDDYWSGNRRYSDLSVGMPMAQAAYYQSYNNGRDEFGRKIRLPNGIDIADGTFWDDLSMVGSDWIQVTFLWLGSDPGPVGAVDNQTTQTNNTAGLSQAIDNPSIEDGAIAVDAGGDGYTPNAGPWYADSCGLNGNHIWTYSTSEPRKSENIATWTPNLPNVGFYEVKAYIPVCGRVEATVGARYYITHAGGKTEVDLNQVAAAGTWKSLGVYPFGGGEIPQVSLSDLTLDNKRSVRFDALAWIPRSDTSTPTTNITNILRKDNGYLVQWNGHDDISGIAAYDLQVRQLPNGGWRDWLNNTGENEAWFGPDETKHFAFRVRARDWANNQEPWPNQANMDTTNITQ